MQRGATDLDVGVQRHGGFARAVCRWLGGPPGGQYTAVGAKASLELWADINECTGTTSTFEKYCERYTQCSNGVEAALCSLPNVDHSPYGNALNLDIASVAWSMFERQPLK